MVHTILSAVCTNRRSRQLLFLLFILKSPRCRFISGSAVHLVKKVPLGFFAKLLSELQNRILLYLILQFCRCGGGLDAKGHPDGFLSRFSSLRSFWLGSFFDSLPGESPCPLFFVCFNRTRLRYAPEKRRAAAETAVKNAIADSTFHHNGFFLRKQPKRRNWTGKIRIDGDF